NSTRSPARSARSRASACSDRSANNLGGLRGYKTSLQNLSLQGEDRLDLREAGHTVGPGETADRRRQPAGVQRPAGRLGARRAARGFAQYLPDADVPYVGRGEKAG